MRQPSGNAKKRRSEAGSPQQPRLPWWKKLLFAAVACAGVLAALELTLTLSGVRPIVYERDPYVGFTSRLPLFVKDPDAADSEALVTAKNKRRFFNVQRFSARKPDGVFRIFCIGGSTTYGHPYQDSTSFCGWLRAMLPKADPTRKWEFINCGGISYASYREALLMEELARYEPDLFIVLSGHNEFLEQRTYSQIIAMPESLRGAGAILGRTRLHAALKSVIDRNRTSPAATNPPAAMLPAEVETLLERVVGPRAYSRDDELQAQIIAHYRFNLARMADIARSAGAQIIYITPASNLRSCSPFKSEHKPSLSESQITEWESLFQQARRAAAAQQWPEALAAIDQAARIDDRHAALHFLRGHVLLELQRLVEARAAFIRARDEDVCPLRALSPMREALKQVATEQRAPWLDLDELFERLSPARAPGDDWFLDHVHPTIEGHRQCALALIEILRQTGIAHPGPAWTAALQTQIKADVESQISPAQHGEALCTLAKVFAWAGKYNEAFQMSQRAVQLAGNDPQVQFEAGKNAAHLKAFDAALLHLRRAVELKPGFAPAHALLGSVLADQGQLDHAAATYEKAIALSPNIPDLHSNYSNILKRQGKAEAAIKALGEALRIAPDYAEAHNNLAWILKDQGKSREALAHFREAARLKPGLSLPWIGIARLLATHPDPAQRDPTQAVSLAERQAQRSEFKEWFSLDTLAAAYAAAGRFDEAVHMAAKAAELADLTHPTEAAAIRNRKILYEQQRPFLDAALDSLRTDF